MKLNRRVFLAGTTALATTVALPVSGQTQLVFDDGFENGVDSTLYGKSTAGAGIVEAATTPSREGRRSLHTRLAKSGTSNYRQEVVLRQAADTARGSPAQGSPFYWLGISIYIPSTSLMSSQSVVLQWHTINDTSGASPVIGIRVVNNRWQMTTWRANDLVFPGNVVTDQWNDWVFRILWRNNATGSIRVWKNGTQVSDQANVQTTWEGENAVPYLKLGRYSSAWISAGNSDPNGSVHETWHDSIRLAFDNNAVYEDVAPGVGSVAPMPPGAFIVE